MTILRIVTLNTWKGDGRYRARVDLMAERLAALAPDIVCLQEALRTADADTAATLAGALDMAVAYSPGRAKRRTVEGRRVASESGLAILCRGRFDAVRRVEVPLHPGDRDRHAQIVDATLETGAARLRVANLHLTHVRAPGGNRARRAQAARIADAALAGSDRPIVFAGDFNARPSDRAVRAITDRDGADAGPEPLTRAPGTLLGERPGAWRFDVAVDHIVLVDPAPTARWRLSRRANALDEADPALGIYPSDHAAVRADLTATGA